MLRAVQQRLSGCGTDGPSRSSRLAIARRIARTPNTSKACLFRRRKPLGSDAERFLPRLFLLTALYFAFSNALTNSNAAENLLETAASGYHHTPCFGHTGNPTRASEPDLRVAEFPRYSTWRRPRSS